MDVLGNREVRIWVRMVKAMVPEKVCQIIYQAIQMHGAAGVSQSAARRRTIRPLFRSPVRENRLHHR